MSAGTNGSAAESELPLAGITVVSLEQAVAGPIATRHLADLGARVIKIERPGAGDFARSYDQVVNGLASHFVWLNRSKESVTLDLATDAGREQALELIDGADVFLQNSAPGVAQKLGLDSATLRQRRPGLVCVNISGYGADGPRRDRKAYDMLIQAETGMVSVTGTPETATKTGIPSADIAAGMYAALSAVSALLRNTRTDVGATIEVSMFDASVEWMGYALYVQMYAGRQIERRGLGHASIAPYDAYPTSDGTILIGVQNDSGWATLVGTVFGRPDMVDDPRFRTNLARVEHRLACDEFVSGQTRQWLTEDLDRRLAEVGVPAAQVNDMAAVVDHPQLNARDRWRMVGTENGDIRALLPPMTFDDVELRMDPVPALGEHNDAVLGGLHADPASVVSTEETVVE
jgi:itaconate CoA-transferase